MNGRYFWALVFIIIGAILLLGNLGFIPNNAWNYIVPGLLIGLGLLLLLALRGSNTLPVVTASVPLGDASFARLVFRHGAGHLTVRPGAPTGQLLEGRFTGGVDKHISRAGEQLEVELQPASQDWTNWIDTWRAGRTRGLEWQVAVSNEIPLAVRLDGGASDTELALDGLRLTDLSINTGASVTRATLPKPMGTMRVDVRSGAASVKLQLPPGYPARIRGNMSLGGLDVDTSRFARRDTIYESDGYEGAVNRIDLYVEGGVGAVEIR